MISKYMIFYEVSTLGRQVLSHICITILDNDILIFADVKMQIASVEKCNMENVNILSLKEITK